MPLTVPPVIKKQYCLVEMCAQVWCWLVIQVAATAQSPVGVLVMNVALMTSDKEVPYYNDPNVDTSKKLATMYRLQPMWLLHSIVYGISLVHLPLALTLSAGKNGRDSVTEALEYVQEIAGQEGNCSFGPTLDLDYNKERWTTEATVAVRAANLLTLLSRTGSHMHGEHAQDEELPYRIVVANVDNNPSVFGSAIAYETSLFRNYTIFCPYAFRTPAGPTDVKDLSIGYNYRTNVTDWFYIPLLNFQNESVDSNFSFRNPRGVNEITESRLQLSDGYWTKPYFDCGGGDVWMVTFSMPFFLPTRLLSTNVSTYLISDHLVFAGVTTIDVELSSLDINQCSGGEDSNNVFDPFVDTHLCKNTTQCTPISGLGFQRGAYLCHCLKGYYFPVTTASSKIFNGTTIEDEYSKKVRGLPNVYDSDEFDCLPCPEKCDDCVDDSPCFLEPSPILKIVSLSVTGSCILMLFFFTVYTWVHRNNKVFKAASPGLLYVFLLGSAIMYSEIILRAVFTGTWPCILQPWIRYIGVALAYGALLFKTWRITVVFTVRSAKPVRIKDARLYIRIAILVLLMVIFLSVGTIVEQPTLEIRETSAKMKYEICTITLWSYIGEGITLLLLSWGIYLCVKVRKAPSAFNESQFISICIYNETLMAVFSILMKTVVLESIEELAADKELLVEVCRVHLTVTIMVALLYGSKIYHVVHFKETGGSQFEMKSKEKRARGGQTVSTGITTLDSISPTIDFCYTNPDVKAEVTRMEKVLDSIKEAMTLRDDETMQTSMLSLDQKQQLGHEQPVVEIEQPVVEIEQPVVENEQPVVEIEQPVVGNEQPVVEIEQPVVENEQPVVEIEQPVVGNEQPVVEIEQPVVKIEQPVVENEQPVVGNEQPVVENEQPVVENEQPVVEKEDEGPGPSGITPAC